MMIAVTLIVGVAAVLIQAPTFFYPAVFFVFPSLVVILDIWLANAEVRQRIWRGFLVGFCFGYGYFVVGLVWLKSGYHVDPQDAWKAPLVGFLLPAYLSVYYGFGFALCGLLWRKRVWRVFALALAFFVGEWLRGWVLTGFPMLAVGEVALALPVSASMLSAVGVTGANGIVPLVGCLPVLLPGLRRGESGSMIVFGCLAVLLAVGIGYSMRWQGSLAESEIQSGMHIRVVQPVMGQRQKLDPDRRDENLTRLVELSNEGAEGKSAPDLVIWPEGSLAFAPALEPEVMNWTMARLANGPTLLTGGLRMEQGGDRYRFYNSVYAGKPNNWTSIYDKRHLIPSQEFLPWEGLFDALGVSDRLMGGNRYYWGQKSNVVQWSGLPPAVIGICYEIMFSGELVSAIQQSDLAPKWIVALSDNSWFAGTRGDRVLLSQARLRAVETGLPVLQAANYGISAYISADGRVRASLASGQEGRLDINPAFGVASIYSRHRILVLWIVGLVLFAGSLVGTVPRQVCEGQKKGPALGPGKLVLRG